MKLPFDRSCWVVQDKLCAGFYPGDREPNRLRDKPDSLFASGIRHVVNLLDEYEMDFCGRLFDPYENTLLTLAKKQCIPVTVSRYPIIDMETPNTEFMKAILDDIDGALGQSKPVYVHCWGGLGRTGAVVGCWIARHGLARGKGVLRKISDQRKTAANANQESPQTATQCAMVIKWKRGM